MTYDGEKRKAEQQNLLFELEHGSGPRLLIAVCDDISEADRLRGEINNALKQMGKRVVNVTVPASTGNLVDAILEGAGSERVEAAHLIEAPGLSTSGVDKLLFELNFQRDALARLEIPIVLWIPSLQLSTLANRAPDFWSRRTAVYYFDEYPLDALLVKIFSDQSNEKLTVKDNTISQSITNILTSERELRQCLLDSNHFSLAKADALIQQIRNGLEALLTECHRGGQLDITLWIWNVAHIDETLERLIGSFKFRLGPADRTYIERNDLIIGMAERIEQLLADYSDQLKQRIRNKQIISIINYFIATVRKSAEKAVERIEQDAELVTYIYDYDESEMALGGGDWMERVFKSKAAAALERWLAGYDDNKPGVFTDEEAAVLKYLYNGGNRSSVKPPCDEAKLLEMVKHLRTKVRLYLGDLHIQYLQ